MRSSGDEGCTTMKKGSHRGVLLIAALLLTVLVCPAAGDQVVLRNGKVVECRVLQRSEKEVRVQVTKGGAALVTTYPMAEVREVIRVAAPPVAATRPAGPQAGGVAAKRPRTGPTYVVAPIRETIGLHATAPLIKTYLNIARVERPDYFILDIDSGGGSVGELGEMLNALAAEKHVKLVAYVRNAHSAAAILAMACPVIVMAPEASIGGAVVYRKTAWGMPENIEEKMQSILRAQFRATAETAGHDPLLVEGMMRTDLAIGRVGTGTSARVVDLSDDSLGQPRAVDEVLKPRGRILTLTAAEAVRCGLAVGTADAPAGAASLVGLAAWSEVSNGPSGAYAAHLRSVEDVAKRYARCIRKAGEAYAHAQASDPRAIEYTVDPSSGEFVGDASRIWRQRSDLCSRYLKDCFTQYDAARRLLAEHPHIALHPGLADRMFTPVSLGDAATAVMQMSRDLKADRKRRGIFD